MQCYHHDAVLFMSPCFRNAASLKTVLCGGLRHYVGTGLRPASETRLHRKCMNCSYSGFRLLCPACAGE